MCSTLPVYSSFPTSEQNNGELTSAYERRLVQEIIKPGGATKKPQESVLNNFTNTAANMDATVIFSILYYVLNEANMEWISKLVSSSESDVLC